MSELSNKQQAALLLREYDELRARLRAIEPKLNKAVAAYGKEQGMWGLSKDAFRIRMTHEEGILNERELEREATRLATMYERAAWEKANA